MNLPALPDMEIHGEGTFTPPPLTNEDLVAILERAERIENQQTKTDLFRLIDEVSRLRGAK